MFATLYAEMRRNREEREEAYRELHHVTPDLRRIEAIKAEVGGVKVTPSLERVFEIKDDDDFWDRLGLTDEDFAG